MMASRGRGIRARKVEAPRPRRSSSQIVPQTEPSRDVEHLVIDKLIGRLENGSLSPSEASSLNLTLKNSGQAIEQNDKGFIKRVFDSLRRSLKSTPLSPITRLYLLEVLELNARGWETHPTVDRYYEKKYAEFNVRQRITRELGGEKALERGSLPVRSISYTPETCNSELTNGNSIKSSTTAGHNTELKRLSDVAYDYGNGVLAFDLSLPEKTFVSVVGKSDGKFVKQIQKLSDTRINAEQVNCDDCRQITIQGPGESSIKKAIAMLDYLLVTGEVNEKCYQNFSSRLAREMSTSSVTSDMNNGDNYETASEGEVFSRQNSLQNFADCDMPCSTPMEQDFLETRETMSLSMDHPSTIRSSSHSSTESLQGRGRGHRSLNRQVSEPSVGSSSSVDRSRTLSNGKSPGAEASLSPTSPVITKEAASGVLGEQDAQVYSIPIRNHVLKLMCTDEQILQEALEVLRTHFLGHRLSDSSMADQSAAASSFDPNNNSASKSMTLPVSVLMTSDLPPLPDSEDDVWTDGDDLCLDTEMQNTLNDLSIEQSCQDEGFNSGKPNHDDSQALQVASDKCRQITSTPAALEMNDASILPCTTALPSVAEVSAPVLEISSIAAPVDIGRKTPASHVLNNAFVSENDSVATPRKVCALLRAESSRPLSIGSDPSIDLEGLVRHEMEGTISMNGSSRLSRSSLSESRNSGQSFRQDRYGFVQPTNIMRMPLNPLASESDIRQADAQSSKAALGATARRKFFAETSRRYYDRLHENEVRGQKVLQYGQNFLLACSRSPLCRQPPREWANKVELPDVCLKQNLGFTASLVDWNMECIPAACNKW